MKITGNPLADYDQSAGTVRFTSPYTGYAYATLDYPYLRVANYGNQMCLDCHNTGSHRNYDCRVCHENHNRTNVKGVRATVKTPSLGPRAVVFSRYTGINSFATETGHTTAYARSATRRRSITGTTGPASLTTQAA